MTHIRVGLNGFGRIGRAFTRIAFDKNSFDIVAVNTRKTKTDMLAYLLKHDSVYRTFNKTVEVMEDGMMVDSKKIATFNFAEPAEIPWEKYEVDVVIDATGAFKDRASLGAHLHGSVKKVIVTAPVKDETVPYVVLGVNDGKIDWTKETVISNASCTTNCSAPMFKVLHDNFKVISGFLTTAHAYTQTQSLLDDSGKTFDRSRAATINIIPSTTGAAKAVAKVIPDLKGKLDGMSIRVPVPTVSFTDISAVVEKSTTVEEINQKFQEVSGGVMKGILSYEKEILVSSDFIGSPYSCIFDSNYTKVINGNLVKIFGWYDNEWGYSARLVELVEKIASISN